MQWWLLLFNCLCVVSEPPFAICECLCVCVRMCELVTCSMLCETQFGCFIFFLFLFFFICFIRNAAALFQITNWHSSWQSTLLFFCEGRRGEKTANVPHSSHNDEDDFCGVWQTKRQTDYIFRLIFFSPRFFIVEWICKFCSRRGHASARSCDGQKAFGGSNMHISRVIILHTFD